jgi:hypothetical protein
MIGEHAMADITLEQLLDRISSCSAEECNCLITAVNERFTEIWPEWELLTISVHGHDAKSHLEALQNSIRLLSQDVKKDLP